MSPATQQKWLFPAFIVAKQGSTWFNYARGMEGWCTHLSTNHMIAIQPVMTFWSKSTILKPKFHYADFATFTETSPRGKLRTKILKVCDTNHVADFYDLCRGLSWFVSWTLSPTFSVYCNVLIPLERHRWVCRWLVTDCVEMVCVCDFHDLCRRFLPKLHDFMIFHHLSPQLS